VNGSIPGPTLFADWGDTVVVHVTNKLTTSNNGSSIHFHGIRQRFTNQNDGVVSITQCPLAVGSTETYVWKAEQYGTSWYHSHFGLQAWQGVFGGIVINGPATANYDNDLGVLFLNDWTRQTADELAFVSKANLLPPLQDNGLLNGTNLRPDGSGRLNMSFESGKSYRLRLVNAGIDTHFKFTLDGHQMTVIAADLVPIKPYSTNVVDIAIGQRYDVIITADKVSPGGKGSFWMRAIPQLPCSLNKNADDIKGIVSYGDSQSVPNTRPYWFLPSCADESQHRTLVPHVQKNVGPKSQGSSETVDRTIEGGLFFWTLNSTSMLVDWQQPTLQQISTQHVSRERNDSIIELPRANTVFYLVIQTLLPIPHPIHLHGHDFFILAQGNGAYSPHAQLNTTNPLRRDTAVLPGPGYLVIAWETDNPGVWLLHCHIGFHVSEGFALQFIERQAEIPSLIDGEKLNGQCKWWSAFQEARSIHQGHSGV
jgi:FtsP/CotA-like multicopper oxidase with cupredoxin domain